MTRIAAIALVAAALAACASGSTRDEGLATLDALREAQAACAAKGGSLQLKPEGRAAYIDAYACQRN